MAFYENELVAYRTILSDAFFIEKKKVSFGWLSGNWVHAKYRRKGFSTLLFNEALKDWGSKLMYTNYAVASKLVYDKTNQFNLLYDLKGTKYFTRFCLADILPLKKKVFKSTKISKVKTNLMVFIKPTILENPEQASYETNKKYNYI